MFFVLAIEGEYLHATVHYLQDAEAASAMERYKQPFLERKYFWPSTRVPLVRSEAEQQTITIEASQAQMDFFNANVESTGSTTFVVPEDDGLIPISDLTIILTDGLEGP